MANTFLSTGRTAGIATSNPVANVEQVNNQTATQPVQNNINVAQRPVQNMQQQSLNPITIPIQIQPQVAPTGQPTTTYNNQTQQNPSNIQTINAQELQTYNAPTPQEYQGANQSNVVDFDQIYDAYKRTKGNTTSNETTVSSGIKKSSIGTTIVTPTTNNLNSVEGQYQSAYADTVNGLISEMLSQLNNGFSYDPTQDESLRLASEYAANSTLQSLAGSGVLNSSATAERIARIVSELIPQYEEKAHSRWIEYLGQLSNTAQIVMNYDSQQFQYWKDAKDREFKEKEFEYQKQQDSLENAWKRVDELGYVDNDASTVLGVPVGTLSKDAREAKEEREFELQRMREQAQLEYENQKALYRLKSELDKEQAQLDYQNQRALYELQSQLETKQSKELADHEYALKQKYSTNNSSNNINLSTYKDIINNRYADYDETSKKYIVSDNVALYNYLISEYSNGRLSASDLATLTTMYNVTQPTEKDIAKQERIKYLESLKQYQ